MSATGEPVGGVHAAGLSVVAPTPSAPPMLSLSPTVSSTVSSNASSASMAQRRAVAIAPDFLELLRPASDLARLLTSFGRADVLLANEAVPMAGREDDPDDWTRDDEVVDAVPMAVDELGHPDLVVHRLGLTPPLRPEMEDDLVAAMSELVGFDPEPLVYCLAPAEPARGVLARTAERIARVYGLPLLRYRCLELTLVDPLDPERFTTSQ